MKSIIHTPTNNIENSLDFYRRLNFKVLSTETPVLVTDGKVMIEINPDRFVRAGVKLYKESWVAEAEKLKKLTALMEIDKGYLLSDFNGVWIYLTNGEFQFEYEFRENSFGIPGNYNGMSLETTDINRSSAIWQALGFMQTGGSLDKGFVTYASEDGLDISLMSPLNCPHLFFNPSLNYFNGQNNLSVIQKIRDAKIPITEEITYFNKEGIVDNIIIRDPGGFGFFIFSD